MFDAEARAQQVEGVDDIAGVGVGLLLNDVPAVADVERRRAHPQPPRKMQAPADLADGRVDELEFVGVPEPGAKHAADRLGPLPIHRSGGQHGPEPHARSQGCRHLLEVTVGERLKEDTPTDQRATVCGSCVADMTSSRLSFLQPTVRILPSLVVRSSTYKSHTKEAGR